MFQGLNTSYLGIQAKSLYISRALKIFYGTEIEILAGFGPFGNTEKKIWANYEQLLRAVFSCFHGQKKGLKFFLRYCSVRTKKLHKMEVKILIFS
jgi:hypothetical protein